jgi:hypothetical protein
MFLQINLLHPFALNHLYLFQLPVYLNLITQSQLFLKAIVSILVKLFISFSILNHGLTRSLMDHQILAWARESCTFNLLSTTGPAVSFKFQHHWLTTTRCFSLCFQKLHLYYQACFLLAAVHQRNYLLDFTCAIILKPLECSVWMQLVSFTRLKLIARL